MERGGKRAAVVWHRRAGKDAVAINWCAVASFRRVGLYWHVLPTYDQGRKIVWEGLTRDGRKFLSAFPGFDNPGGADSLVRRKRDDKMFLELINGSVYQVVGTDEIDRLVGANPIGVVFSEYSLHNPAAWEYIRPILAENGGWAMFIYTIRGKNHGYKLLQMAKKNPAWFAEDLTIDHTKKEDGTPVITPEDVQAEREAGMPEEIIQQEFYNNPNAALVGAYYKKEMADALAQGRITRVPWEPTLPVDTFWDLGVSDRTVVGFFQRVGAEIRMIDCVHAEGEGIQYYIKELDKKPYKYGEHWAPHDIKVRELTAAGKSRWEIARSLGVTFLIVPKLPVADGIAAVRATLPKVVFDETKCDHVIEGLREYTKVWDPVALIFKDTPLHNWASHPADMMRYMATGYRLKRTDKAPQTHAINDYDPMSGTEHTEREALTEYNEFSD